MSQYPVESDEQLYQAVNYLLSGPGGLGQNFEGFSTYLTGYSTGNFRPPFTLTGVARLSKGKSGEFTIVVSPDSTGIQVGYLVTGTGIGVSATVVGLSYSLANGYTVTLSVANSAKVDSEIIFSPPPSLYPTLYVAPIPLGVSEMLDERTWKFNFAAPEAAPPFVPGQPITVAGVTDSYYDGDYAPIGVAECTTDYVIARTDGSFEIVPPSSGGDVYFYNTLRSGSDATISTDANGKVTITGATDRVFLSAQLNNVISYIDASATNFRYTAQISRLKGVINNDPINPEYRFVPDGIVAQKVYNYTLTGSSDLDDIETIFTAIIDQPTIGYYWYILEVQYKNLDWNGSGSLPAFQVTDAVFTQRGLSAQVVKE